MQRMSCVAALGLALLACSRDVNFISGGTYTCKGGPLGGAQLTIDADKTSVRLALPGAAPVRRTGKPWARANWPTLCPRGMTDTSSEVISLGPEPLVLGATTIERPALVANCVKKPIVELRSLDAAGQIDKTHGVDFER